MHSVRSHSWSYTSLRIGMHLACIGEYVVRLRMWTRENRRRECGGWWVKEYGLWNVEYCVWWSGGNAYTCDIADATYVAIDPRPNQCAQSTYYRAEACSTRYGLDAMNIFTESSHFIVMQVILVAWTLGTIWITHLPAVDHVKCILKVESRQCVLSSSKAKLALWSKICSRISMPAQISRQQLSRRSHTHTTQQRCRRPHRRTIQIQLTGTVLFSSQPYLNTVPHAEYDSQAVHTQ